MHAEIHALTDIGLKRTQNEDHHAWWSSAAGEPAAAVMVVADGMGGALAGEVASLLTVEYVLAASRAIASTATEESLRQVVEEANTRVHHESVTHAERRGMGTTCTVLIVRPRVALYAHVGDSRAYHVHDGTMRQITRDHSLVAQLVEFQHLTPEEAKVDPRRNVVTRSLGVGPGVEVDTGVVPLESGDTLLLSSDGLHGLVEDDELLAHAMAADLTKAGTELIELAKARGGPDNITVVLARFRFDASESGT
jgi:serine/threonine protein phosphatase PrpC